jgi:hypothetical protein
MRCCKQSSYQAPQNLTNPFGVSSWITIEEAPMGLFRRILKRDDIAAAPQVPEETLGRDDVLPAQVPTSKDNPKLVIAGVAAAAAAAGAAIAYAAMKRRRPDTEA